MASAPLLDPRILVLGLRDPSFPEGGAGTFLARSLRVSLDDVEVVEASSEQPDFGRLLRDFDVIIILDCIAMCSTAGQVSVVSPYALPDLKGDWDDHARALYGAIHEARILGHRVPAIYVVAVCMPDRDGALSPQSPALSGFYRAVAPRAKQIVRDIIRAAREPGAEVTQGAGA